jgi:hypothetical protein
MTRVEVEHWLGDHWRWALLVGAFTVGGYVVRIEAAINRMDEATVNREVVRGIGRLVCVADRDRALLAGIPCGELLDERAR